MKPIYILGISAFYHDAAAALLRDGEILAAAQEERFSRRKHDPNFPELSIRYCVEEAGIDTADLDYIVFYDKPFVKFDRILTTYLSYAPRGIKSFLASIPPWIKEKIFIKDILEERLKCRAKILFCRHHEAHAASAFFPSPFEEAAVLTMDGVGEWATTTFGIGKDNTISITDELRFPHSLGLLYSAFTYYSGFSVNSGEYKLMGLAPYGEPRHVELIKRELIDIKEDGSFRLNMDYFDYCTGLAMINKKFEELFGGPARVPGTGKITQRHMDAARSIQAVIEEVIVKIAGHVFRQTGKENLCMAGGVALNCVANGRLLREGPFRNIWVQPASTDAGGALGAALAAWHIYLKKARNGDAARDSMKTALLGPAFSDDEIESCLKANGAIYEKMKTEEIAPRAARIIADQKVLGWFQGRMEYGPRALGNRSILGDPRSDTMQSLINDKIKFRESFRPFAPTVLAERMPDYFEMREQSPYMLLVAYIKKDKRVPGADQTVAVSGFDKLKIRRSLLPAVTHVDYSARVQTVTKDGNGLYYDLVNEFFKLTGCPVVVNTSFNLRGEPIVCRPEEAYRCFMCTEMDSLIMGSFLLDKASQRIT
jgi:carbamoyltransferase